MGTMAGPSPARWARIRSMWLNDDELLVPENIFNVLCQNVPKFESKRQDAVEALRYILDGIDMEASKRLKGKKGCKSDAGVQDGGTSNGADTSFERKLLYKYYQNLSTL